MEEMDGKQQGLEMPPGFSDMLIEGEPDAQKDEQAEQALLDITNDLSEKTATIIHEAFDREMKKRGRPGLGGVPAEDLGKISAMMIPDKHKKKSPAAVLLTVWTYILTDNFVISAPESEPKEEETNE